MEISFSRSGGAGDVQHAEIERVLHVVAEVALIVLLFIDAAQIDLKALQRQHAWPQRMLLIGLPSAIALGGLTAWLFLPEWPVFALLLVAAILAPTDAALGQGAKTGTGGHLPGAKVKGKIAEVRGLNEGESAISPARFPD